MQHDGKLEHFPFGVPLFVNKNPARENLLHNNHRNLSIPKDFNKNTDTSSSFPPKDTISCHKPKVNSVRFEDPYYQINHVVNTNDYNDLIDAHE